MDQSPPKRQQMKACDTCRRRKVRCDTINQSPCSNCRKLGAECRFTTNWKRPARPRKLHRKPLGPSQPTVGTSPAQTGASSSTSEQESPYDAQDASRDVSGLPSSVVISQGLARNGLAQFFQHGIGTSHWDVFDTKKLVRIAYIGTDVSNLSHLINLEGQGQGGQRFALPLHLPHPQIRPTVPWKPEADQNLFGIPMRNGFVDQIRDLSSFPAKDVRDSLVDAYFDQINPCFPVIDEFDFRRSYAETSNPPPLILLQAVLLAGAHVCDHPKVVQSRTMVKTALFRRAKALFDMRHENDRLHLVQCALLFTWHLENADTASANSYYWAGVACRIAFGVGMHRDLSSRNRASMMPVDDRRIYRRVWWTLFQTEIFTALEHGRPTMLQPEEFDQPPLELDDFREENGHVNEKLNYDYCSRNIELSYMILDILKLKRPGVTRQSDLLRNLTSLDSRLANWILTTPTNDEFWSLQLHMHYHTILIHLHRMFLTDRTAATVAQQQQSIEICNRAVSAIIAAFETMLARQCITQCYFTSVIALTATAIHVSREIRLAIEQGSTLLALNTLNQLERLFRPAKELSQYWPNAEAVLNLFQSLMERFKTRIVDILGKSAPSESSNPIQAQPSARTNRPDLPPSQEHYMNGSADPNTNFYNIDWQDILVYPVMQPEYFSGDEDWMNVSPEIGMEI